MKNMAGKVFCLFAIIFLLSIIGVQGDTWGLDGDLNGDGCVDDGYMNIILSYRNQSAVVKGKDITMMKRINMGGHFLKTFM